MFFMVLRDVMVLVALRMAFYQVEAEYGIIYLGFISWMTWRVFTVRFVSFIRLRTEWKLTHIE